MKKSTLLVIGLASLVVSNLQASTAKKDIGAIFESRCANCHGATADGVPKIKEKAGVVSEKASATGVSSQEKANIYGPPLNNLSKEELVSQLLNLRNQDFDANSPHSVMRKNLEKIEKREGKVSDEEMAEYISTTFGPASK
ncbi:MAG: hypothetical protein PHU40_07115 [Sulfurimonas sp.]|nr:hypothetical protein [Sulfurimonas sp.]